MAITKAEINFWKKQKSYTLLEAAYLIVEESPPAFTEKENQNVFPPLPSKKYETPTFDPKAMKVFGGLISLITKKEIPLSRCLVDVKLDSHETDFLEILLVNWQQYSILNLSEIFRLDRADLIEFFSRNPAQPKPKFLFPDDERPKASIEWLSVEIIKDIEKLWNAFLKKQKEYLKTKAKTEKISREQIDRATLKALLIRAHCEKESTISKNIIDKLNFKFTRGKETFICDIVRNLAREREDEQIALLGDSPLYDMIPKRSPKTPGQ